MKTPAEVLHALREGDIGLDRGETRTESILKCIDYSHSNLSPEARSLLECFAPFTGVVFLPMLDEYVQSLREQPELAALPWERIPNVLEEAERWGLVRVEEPFLHLQPVLPFFLRSRADANGGADAQGSMARNRAVEEAFRKHYHGLCGAIFSMQRSKEPKQRQTGQLLAQAERENVLRALDLSLAKRESILEPYRVLSQLFDQTQDHTAGLALAEKVTASIEDYPQELLAGPLGLEIAIVVDGAAKRFLLLKRFGDAEAGYRRALGLLLSTPTKERTKFSASIYHQLGAVAREQRQWAEAEKNLREALRIFVEFQDQHNLAITLQSIISMASERPGMKDRVAEILGWPAEDVQKLFETGAAAAVPE
jgi:tetratricopeptide (TPR) repeat protein